MWTNVDNPIKLHKTNNRKLILRILINQPPCTAKQIYEALQLAFDMRQYRMVTMPSLMQTCRTLRELVKGGVIARCKQTNVYQYSRLC